MEEQIISFETAKLAKEKGFDIRTKGYYNNGIYKNTGSEIGQYHSFTNGIPDTNDNGICLAPTQSLLQKWLREKHQINCEAQSLYDERSGLIKYESCIFSQKFKEEFTLDVKEEDVFLTYEEALEDCLQEALKNKDLWEN